MAEPSSAADLDATAQDGARATRDSHCPPLRTRHLLAWIAVTAIVMPSQRGFVLDRGVDALGNVLLFSGAATLLGLAGVWSWRGEFRRSPGQGFVAFAAMYFVSVHVASLLHNLDGLSETVLFGGPGPPRYTGDLLYNRFQTVVLATTAVVSAIVFADSSRWRLVLAIAAVSPIESVVLCVGWDFFQDRGALLATASTVLASAKMLEQVAIPATFVALLWAILIDKRLGVARDWTHWYGCALWCWHLYPAVMRALRL